MRNVTIPIGPGKGQEKLIEDALYSLMGEMQSHARDLRDMKQAEQANDLERYATAIELIFWQIATTGISGADIPANVRKLAEKYHLATPKNG